MTARGIAFVALALAGCDVAFGIDGHAAPDAPDAPAEACPAAYVPAPGGPPDGRYKYVESPKLIWDYAEQTCLLDTTTKITHLAVFDTRAEMDAVRKVFALGIDDVYVGYAKDVGQDYTAYRSVTGVPLPDGSPLWDGNGGVQLEPDGGRYGNAPEQVVWFAGLRDLTDGPWDAELGYICECDHAPATEVFHTH